jgi:hypothetical protein
MSATRNAAVTSTVARPFLNLREPDGPAKCDVGAGFAVKVAVT